MKKTCPRNHRFNPQPLKRYQNATSSKKDYPITNIVEIFFDSLQMGKKRDKPD
jgi:hypothetical protein